MNQRKTVRLLLAVVLLGLFIPSAMHASQPAERTFDFNYKTTINNVPEGTKKVAVWLPYPVSDDNQQITDLKVTSPYPTSIHKDGEYGNTILYVEVAKPASGSIPLEMSFRVKRKEYIRRGPGSGEVKVESAGALKRWLQPDKLVPLDDFVKKLSAEVTAGKTSDLEKARAIYDYAVTTVKYDKTGTGWGRGDIYYACNIKKGNCTDFHALFIGLARAAGIPAKFAIGFPLPEGKQEGEIGGYHCWAEFHLKGYGWVPVDASEASKNPAKAEYFFGAHDVNRVQLTIGRDIRLAPPQHGDPMNYFIYPYVEVDGKPFTEFEKKFAFKDQGAPPAASASTSGR